jgi:ABC-2 type transport system ATP-binding protein
VRSADAERLAALLHERGIAAEPHDSNALLVREAPDLVGAVAAEHRVALVELVAVSRSLEEAFLELTEGQA